jgi:hypothetical protein
MGWYVACNTRLTKHRGRARMRSAANNLSSVEVRSPAGEDVGKVVDFMLDTERQSVVYAVLAVGGVLGVGAKMLAIPPASLAYDSGSRCLSLAVDTATLDEAAGIDRANPPEHADGSLYARGRSHPSSDSTSRNQR